MKLVVRPPNRQTPGFLRRQRRSLEIGRGVREAQAALKHTQDSTDEASALAAMEGVVNAIDSMIEFVLDYIVEPTDRDEARTLLLDLNEDQYDEILAQIRAGTSVPLSAPPRNGSSGSGSAAELTPLSGH